MEEVKKTAKTGATKPPAKTAGAKSAAKPAGAKAGAPKAAGAKSAGTQTAKPPVTAKAGGAQEKAAKPPKPPTPEKSAASVTADIKEKARQAEVGKIEAEAQAEVEAVTEDDIIPLVNDEGQTVNFYHVATIDYENEWYVFFQPAEKMAEIDEDEVVVFKLESDEEDNDVFLPVADEDLLQKVYAEYVRLMEQEGEDGCGGGDCSACPGCGK